MRLDQAYEFKGRGDSKVQEGKLRDAISQYEYAYGMFKYCEKQGRKIVMKDEAKSQRDLRLERKEAGIRIDSERASLWIQIDEMLSSCCVMIATCKLGMFRGDLEEQHQVLEDALAAANEALDIRPNHTPAFYRRSIIHEKLEMWSEAVDDARKAYRYAPDEFKFDLWKHREATIATRRKKTYIWSVLGFLADVPRNCVGLPWRIARLGPLGRASFFLILAIMIGAVYQAPGKHVHQAVWARVGAQGRHSTTKGAGPHGIGITKPSVAISDSESKLPPAPSLDATTAEGYQFATVPTHTPIERKNMQRHFRDAIKNMFTVGGLIPGKHQVRRIVCQLLQHFGPIP